MSFGVNGCFRETMFVLETPRLRLRHLRHDETDIEAISAIFSDPVVTQFFPSTYSRIDVDKFIQRQLNRYAGYGYGLWAVTLKTNGQVIGDCGLVSQVVNDIEEVEVGYHFNRSFQRLGYATEAAIGCMNLAFDQLGLSRLISMIRPENVPSRRVAEKNGMTVKAELFWHGYMHLLYSMNRPASRGANVPNSI
jgi:RimJ/RimL family protein N-acetyltransferase